VSGISKASSKSKVIIIQQRIKQDKIMINDILGWIGTGLILYSFTLNDIKKLRIVNMIGSIAWITYGIQTRIMPTIFVNACVLIIHAVWLIRNKSNKNRNTNTNKSKGIQRIKSGSKSRLVKRGSEWPV
jgi:hypothetical protein